LIDDAINLIVWDSRNAKTGPVEIALYRPQCSCPSWCPLFGHGCYAENRGKAGPFGHASRGRARPADLVRAFEALPPGSRVRLNVSGDYLLEGGAIDHGYIEATNVLAGKGHMVLSYTHAWQVLDPEWFHPDVRPNASCDTVMGLGSAINAGWTAVIVDPHEDYPQGSKFDGHTFVTCLYETPRKTQCIECGLCARPKRPSVVVFPVHGARKKAAAAALEAL
jgi:hypothetical protein